MAKLIPDAILDKQLDQSCALATRLYICSTQPTTFTEASSTYKLGEITLVPGTAFSKANGDVSGRKCILAAQNGIPITVDGNAQHYALCIFAASEFCLAGTVTPQQVYNGNTVNFPATDVDEIRDVA